MSDIHGLGVGLRPAHLKQILISAKQIDWFEVLADNFMHPAGLHLQQLEKVRNNYPITLHCVGLNIGSIDPINDGYLQKLKRFIQQFEPFLVSDHLAWIGCDQTFHHDLLPLPFTEETLRHVCARIHFIQERLDRPFIIENVSSYLQFNFSSMDEWQFLKEITSSTGCKLLLDVNNVYVSAINQGFDPKKYLDCLPRDAVAQYHVAGFTTYADGLLDSHSRPVSREVLDLLSYAQTRFGLKPLCLEWDNDLPTFATLIDEALTLRPASSSREVNQDAAL